jgi:hypothetical protein
MRSDELDATVRLNVTLEDTSVDYPKARVLIEMNDALTTKFQRSVLDAKANYWIQPYVTTTVSGQAKIRIPPRAIGLSKIEIGTGSPPDYQRLHEVSEGHADDFEKPSNQLGTPSAWVARGDQVQLLPVADSTLYSIRIWYYIRPSKLVTSQSSTLVGAGDAVDRGRITAVNTVARTVTVNALPFDQLLGTPAAITSAVQKIDIVHPDGWHELALVGATQTISGLVFTIGGTDDLDEVLVGDYVRVAEQTDWPALPDDFHRCLADVTSVKILMQQSNAQKAAGFATDVSADLQRFSELIGKRTLEEPRTIKPYAPMLRRRW